jgi:hypothetical protein
LCGYCYDAEGSGGFHYRGLPFGDSGRSANSVPGTHPTAQRGHSGLETSDESTSPGTLPNIKSSCPRCGEDAQIRKQQSRGMRYFGRIAEPCGRVPPRSGASSRQHLFWTAASAISSRYHPALRSSLARLSARSLIPKVTQSKTDFRFSLRFLLRCLSIASSANLIAVSLLNAVPVFVRISSRLMTHFQPVGLAV